MPARGGSAAKAGARYEAIWTAFCMLDVLSGRATSIWLEPLEAGIEFVLSRRGAREYHQVKRQQRGAGGWTVRRLAAAGVLTAFGEHLGRRSSRCVFVSTQPAVGLQELSQQAVAFRRYADFVRRAAQSHELEADLRALAEIWGIDEESVWRALRRIRVETISEAMLLTSTVERAQPMLVEPVSGVRVLAELSLELVHRRLTRRQIEAELRQAGVALKVRGADVLGGGDRRSKGLTPPAPRPFVGRRQELRTAVESLTRAAGGGQSAGVVVHGWPGIGKSSLAAHVTHQASIATAFPDGVIWAGIGQRPEPFEVLRRWARALDVRYPDGADLATAAHQLAGATRAKRCLFVFDDVWTPGMVRAVNIAGRRSGILVTTRLPVVADELIELVRLRLRGLKDRDALLLLEAIVPGVSRDAPAETAALLRAADGLPLTLGVAGRLIRAHARRGADVQALMAELADGVGLLDARSPGDRPGDDEQMTPTVRHIVARSVDALDDFHRSCFAQLAYVPDDPATFSADLLGHLWDVPDPQPVIATLVDLGLLEHVGAGRFRVHALLQLFARSLGDAA